MRQGSAVQVESMSQHGFARNSKWEVRSAETRMNGECHVVLTLTDSEATRAKYPHHFLLEYVVSLDEKRLLTSLKMTNMDEEGTIAPQALLHTYFRTADIEDTEVLGLAGHTYFDQLTSDKSIQTGDTVSFRGEIDRIYSEVKEKRIKIGRHGQRGVVELSLECAYQEEFGELGTVPKQINPDVVASFAESRLSAASEPPSHAGLEPAHRQVPENVRFRRRWLEEYVLCRARCPRQVPACNYSCQLCRSQPDHFLHPGVASNLACICSAVKARQLNV